MNRKAVAVVLAAILIDLVALNVAAFAPGARAPAPPAAESVPAAVRTAAIPIAGSTAALETTLEQIYRAVSPSVVAIRVVQKQASPFPAIPEIPGFPFFGPPPGQP